MKAAVEDRRWGGVRHSGYCHIFVLACSRRWANGEL